MIVTPYPFKRTKNNFAEREGYWDLQTTISSPDSTVPDQVTPISSDLASELSSGTPEFHRSTGGPGYSWSSACQCLLRTEEKEDRV